MPIPRPAAQGGRGYRIQETERATWRGALAGAERFGQGMQPLRSLPCLWSPVGLPFEGIPKKPEVRGPTDIVPSLDVESDGEGWRGDLEGQRQGS